MPAYCLVVTLPCNLERVICVRHTQYSSTHTRTHTHTVRNVCSFANLSRISLYRQRYVTRVARGSAYVHRAPLSTNYHLQHKTGKLYRNRQCRHSQAVLSVLTVLHQPVQSSDTSAFVIHIVQTCQTLVVQCGSSSLFQISLHRDMRGESREYKHLCIERRSSTKHHDQESEATLPSTNSADMQTFSGNQTSTVFTTIVHRPEVHACAIHVVQTCQSSIIHVSCMSFAFDLSQHEALRSGDRATSSTPDGRRLRHHEKAA